MFLFVVDHIKTMIDVFILGVISLLDYLHSTFLFELLLLEWLVYDCAARRFKL